MATDPRAATTFSVRDLCKRTEEDSNLVTVANLSFLRNDIQ